MIVDQQARPSRRGLPPLTTNNLQTYEFLVGSDLDGSYRMTRILNRQPEEQSSTLEDSTFELVSNPSVLSDDDGQTVSVASLSVNGDIADDFSSVNSNVEYTSDEDESTGGDHDADYLEYPPPSERLSTHHSFLSQSDVGDSGMTVKPNQSNTSRGQSALDQSTSTNEKESKGTEEAQRSQKRLQPSAAKKTGCPNYHISTALKEKFDTWKASPAGQYTLSLPWLWIIGLALVNITAIYATTCYVMGPGIRRIEAPVPAYNPCTYAITTAKPSQTTGWFALIPSSDTVITKTTVVETTLREKKDTSDKARSKVETNKKEMNVELTKMLASNLPQDVLGHTLSTDFAGGEGFRLLSFGEGTGFLIIHPPALTSRDLPISVFAARKNVAVPLQMTTLRRGYNYVQISPEDAHGTVDFLIKTERKPFHYQHQRIRFGSSWLPLTMDPLKWLDAASKAIAAVREEALALEAKADELLMPVSSTLSNGGEVLSREGKKLADSALQRIEQTTKELMKLPHPHWTKKAHHLLSKKKAIAAQVLKQRDMAVVRLNHGAHILQHNVARAYADLCKAVAARAPAADLALPLSNPVQALQNAESNARDIVSRFRAMVTGEKSKKSCGKKASRKAHKKAARQGKRKQRR